MTLTNKTYRFSTFQELVDVVPSDRIRDCMEELGTTFAMAKGATDLHLRTVFDLAGLPYTEGRRVINLPPVIEWIDDGKRELEAIITHECAEYLNVKIEKEDESARTPTP